MCAKHSIAETWYELNYVAHSKNSWGSWVWVAAPERFCNLYFHLSLKTIFAELKLTNHYINIIFFFLKVDSLIINYPLPNSYTHMPCHVR